MNAIVIADVAIRTDAEWRYCLNDLHRAAGGEAKYRPNYWIENAQTQELVAETEKAGNPAIHANKDLAPSSPRNWSTPTPCGSAPPSISRSSVPTTPW